MTTWQAMNKLERLGYQFEATADGVRVTLQGEAPPEASAPVGDRPPRPGSGPRLCAGASGRGGIVAEDGCTYSVLEALAIAQAIRKGEARLLGKVIFHRPAGNVSVYWEPLTGESPEVLLTRYREALTNALEARLKAMDESPYLEPVPGRI